MTKPTAGHRLRSILAITWYIFFWIGGLSFVLLAIVNWIKFGAIEAFFPLIGFAVCIGMGLLASFLIGLVGYRARSPSDEISKDLSFSCHLVRCERGREEEVAREVLLRASSLKMNEFFREAVALSEKVTEIRQGVKRTGPPSYAGLVGIKMIFNSPSRHCVLETRGVKEFVNETALPEDEINRLIKEAFET